MKLTIMLKESIISIINKTHKTNYTTSDIEIEVIGETFCDVKIGINNYRIFYSILFLSCEIK